MPTFSYRVRESSGQAGAGLLEAPSLLEAGRQLRAEGKTIVELQPGSNVPAAPAEAGAPPARPRRVGADEVLMLTNQLAVMLETGVPLAEALQSIAVQTRHSGVAHLVGDLAGEVQGGSDFSAALRRHERLFGELYVNTVAASEASGTMAEMLQRLSAYLTGQREMRKQIRGAMLYPVCILCFSIVVVVLMMLFVLPRFETIYSGKQAVLPMPTRILLGASHVLRGYWWLILGGAAAAVAGAVYGLRTPKGRHWRGRMCLRMPVTGTLYHKVFISRCLRTLATMLASRVEMLNAIRITASVAGNPLYHDMWLGVADNLAQGRTLTEEMHGAALVPPGIAQMIACGDKSGRLPEVMNRIADFCESDLRVGIKAMTSLMEPAMIIAMGFIVGGIAMALLLPVFNIGKVVAH